jgi:uncharacterized protein (DUF58 family)
MTTTLPHFLDTTELRLLEGMRLRPRRHFPGRVHGERLSHKKGISIEFADFRNYTMGDDLRHLDWNILARLDRPTIRTYQDEEDLAVYIALDVSRSMDFGEPTKFSHATRLAALFGFLGLIGQDAVYPVALGSTNSAPGRVLRGRGCYRLLAEWLSAQRPEGKCGLAVSLARFAMTRSVRPGLFICVTDGLDPAASDAIRTLAVRGHEPVLVQVLAEIEWDPDLEGDLRLLDAESGEAIEVTAHAQTLREYKKNLATHCRMLEETTWRVGGRYLRSAAGQSLSEFIRRGIRRVGLAK